MSPAELHDLRLVATESGDALRQDDLKHLRETGLIEHDELDGWRPTRAGFYALDAADRAVAA